MDNQTNYVKDDEETPNCNKIAEDEHDKIEVVKRVTVAAPKDDNAGYKTRNVVPELRGRTFAFTTIDILDEFLHSPSK